MSKYISLQNKLRLIQEQSEVTSDFEALAMEIFLYQLTSNKLYADYCQLLGRNAHNVKSLTEIPFLPISFFKTHTIKSGEWATTHVFESSGTTGTTRSRHHIRDMNAYLKNAISGFEQFYGKVRDFCFLAVLPGYQERENSSLIYMVNEFIRVSRYEASGFYLHQPKKLKDVLNYNQENNIPTVLFGVSFGLLELSNLQIEFPELIVLETGGMKNSKVELSKEEIIAKLKDSWKLSSIHSEYGMTELLSQSYSQDGKWYNTANTKKVLIGQLRDPLAMEKPEKTGIVKIVDLANINTCSFIETEDLGVINEHDQFQILGRMDHAELRGCNLLLDDALENPIR